MVNAKALWESLERKYKTEDTGSNKFVVGKFLDFKMVDSKTVISQVQEFQLILHDIHAEGMVLGESFQVAALIEKLPPTWKDFKNYLKHKRKEMKLKGLIVRLRIEEDNRQSEKKAGNYHQEAKANVVEQEWLQQVEQLDTEVGSFIVESTTNNNGETLSKYCPSCCFSCKPGLEVTRKLKDVKQLKDQGLLLKQTADDELERGKQEVPKVQSIPGPSVLKSLNREDVNRIGVWGMGGVSKTTLVRTLYNTPSFMQPFSVVILVTVSKQLDMRRV
ncbi:hypothetical protein RJ639_008026 [Escallonia herrerae]|uniref:NB-ARC domain-containing protein n=1 Tax=Escallonia herrerae TaxID=1293975 RepID=A0AA88VSZ1_9ASTE|nr:hypothetical protein RJ639_008026 [Escallonia herrerae]